MVFGEFGGSNQQEVITTVRLRRISLKCFRSEADYILQDHKVQQTTVPALCRDVRRSTTVPNPQQDQDPESRLSADSDCLVVGQTRVGQFQSVQQTSVKPIQTPPTGGMKFDIKQEVTLVTCFSSSCCMCPFPRQAWRWRRRGCVETTEPEQTPPLPISHLCSVKPDPTGTCRS